MRKIQIIAVALFLSAAGWGGASYAEGLPAPEGSEGTWSDFASRQGDEIAFGDALSAITDLASRDLFGEPVDREALRETIRRLAWKVRGGIVGGGSHEVAEAFRHAFFVVEGLEPDGTFGAKFEPETTVLSSVLENRRGVCLSLSLLYLAVADEAGLPLYGVSVPDHFFVRYASGEDRLNIETLQQGRSGHKDRFYRKKFFVRPDEPFYLENLSSKMSLAAYLSQVGVLYLQKGLVEKAVEILEVARDASPTDPEIRTNLGIALHAAGRPDDALLSWRNAIVLDPYDDVAHHHLAAALGDRGEWLEAIYHFDESLRLGHPLDLALMRRLEPHRPDALYPSARVPEASVSTVP